MTVDTGHAIDRQPSASRLRFSVRTLLIAITILTVVVALWCAAAIRQQRVIVALRKAGGSVAFDEEARSLAWLDGFANDDFLGSVQVVWVDELSSEDLQLLSTLQVLGQLETLSASECEFPANAFVPLEGKKSLQSLYLYDTNVNDADLASLATLPNLRQLGLSRTAITDAGIATLVGLPSLTYLSLNETRLTDKVVDSLVQMPQLAAVELHGTLVSGAALERLRVELPTCEVNGVRGDGHPGKPSPMPSAPSFCR